MSSSDWVAFPEAGRRASTDSEDSGAAVNGFNTSGAGDDHRPSAGDPVYSEGPADTGDDDLDLIRGAGQARAGAEKAVRRLEAANAAQADRRPRDGKGGTNGGGGANDGDHDDDGYDDAAAAAADYDDEDGEEAGMLLELVHERLSSLGDHHESLVRRVLDQRNSISALRADLASRGAECASLRATCDAQRNSIVQLEGTVETRSRATKDQGERIADLEGQLAAARVEIDKLSDPLRGLDGDGRGGHGGVGGRGFGGDEDGPGDGDGVGAQALSMALEQSRAEVETQRMTIESEREARKGDARRHTAALAAYEERLAAAEARGRALEAELGRARAGEDERAGDAERIATLEAELAAARAASAERAKRFAARLAVLSEDWDAASREAAALRSAQSGYAASAARGKGDFPSLVRSLREQLAVAARHNAAYVELAKSLQGDLDAATDAAARESARAIDAERALERTREDLDEALAAGRGARSGNAPRGRAGADGAAAAASAGAADADPELLSNAAKVDAVLIALERGGGIDPDADVDELGRHVTTLAEALDFVTTRRAAVAEDVSDLAVSLSAERRARKDAVAARRRVEDRCAELESVMASLERENAVAVEQMLRLGGRAAGSTAAGAGGPGSAAGKPGRIRSASSASIQAGKVARTQAPPQQGSSSSSSSSSSSTAAAAAAGRGSVGARGDADAAASAPPARSVSAAGSATESNLAGAEDGEDAVRPLLRRGRVSSILRSRVSAEDVDQRVEELKVKFRENGVDLPLVRSGDYVYILGSRKVTLTASDNKLLVRMGGGVQSFLEFLEKAKF